MRSLEYGLVCRCVSHPNSQSAKDSQSIDRRTRLGIGPVAYLCAVWIARFISGCAWVGQNADGQEFSERLSLAVFSNPIHARLDA